MTLDPVVPGRHVRLAYALAALGCAAFTLYGSLVPFRFSPRDLGDALGAFEWACTQRSGIDSRGDWLANCLLGVPLGFSVVGALRVRHRRGAGDWLAAGAAVAFGGLFATGVEFLQLFVPGRTCSASDILAQTLGSAVGAVGWLAAGPTLTRRTRELWADPRSGGSVGQLLLGYAVFVMLVQTLPLDILTSPTEVYHKLRDGAKDGRLTVVPFADFPGADPGTRVQTWLELVGLFLPAGLLASRFPRAGGWSRTEVFGAGVVFALATELAQVLVSRHPSASDVLVGGVGVLAGFAAGRGDRRLAFALAAVWLAALAVTHWQPFRFALPAAGGPSWLPFADAQRQDYLTAFDGLFARGVMFAPVGALAAYTGRPAWAGAAAGLVVAVVLEAGQLFTPDRSAATTELVLGPAGALAGAVAAVRLARPGDRTS